GGLDSFPRRVAIAPIARAPVRAPDAVRRAACPPAWLDGPPRPLVLASFGGFGGDLDLRDALARNPDYRFLVVSGPPDLALENARSIEPARAGAAHADAGGARMPGDLTGEPTHA